MPNGQMISYEVDMGEHKLVFRRGQVPGEILVEIYDASDMDEPLSSATERAIDFAVMASSLGE